MCILLVILCWVEITGTCGIMWELITSVQKCKVLPQMMKKLASDVHGNIDIKVMGAEYCNFS